MISVKITNLKTFTSHLLVKETFSQLELVEAQIQTHSAFHINGRINPSYFNTDEENPGNTSSQTFCYNQWGTLRPICYEIIKGRQLPAFFKFVFRLDCENVRTLLSNLPDIKEQDIDGLYLNVKYENGALTLTTGTSLKIFTMDKSLDKAFDTFLTEFLDENTIDFSIL